MGLSVLLVGGGSSLSPRGQCEASFHLKPRPRKQEKNSHHTGSNQIASESFRSLCCTHNEQAIVCQVSISVCRPLHHFCNMALAFPRSIQPFNSLAHMSPNKANPSRAYLLRNTAAVVRAGGRVAWLVNTRLHIHIHSHIPDVHVPRFLGTGARAHGIRNRSLNSDSSVHPWPGLSCRSLSPHLRDSWVYMSCTDSLRFSAVVQRDRYDCFR